MLTPEGNVFGVSCSRLHEEIARDDPQAWKKRFAQIAQEWAEHRSSKHRTPSCGSHSVTG